MRKILALAVAIAAIPSYAAAQNVTSGFYGEVGIGLSLLENTQTEQFSRVTGSGTLLGTLDVEYSSPQGMFGGEAGFATGRWRFGVSYDWTDASVDTGAFSGTFNNSPLDLTLEKSDLDGIGIVTDTAFLIAAGNVYHSFLPARSAVEPYIGIGAGAAFVQNGSTELALSATLGARYAISSRAYVGARYRFIYVGGPELDDGIKYEDVLMHTVSVQLGIYFGS